MSDNNNNTNGRKFISFPRPLGREDCEQIVLEAATKNKANYTTNYNEQGERRYIFGGVPINVGHNVFLRATVYREGVTVSAEFEHSEQNQGRFDGVDIREVFLGNRDNTPGQVDMRRQIFLEEVASRIQIAAGKYANPIRDSKP